VRSPRVLLITDAGFSDDVALRTIDLVGRALPPGAFAVQLREKGRVDRAAWAGRVRDVTRALHVPLIVNGDVELARAIGADGVHFAGQTPASRVAEAVGLWRSVAVHADEEVVIAAGLGIDALLVSPIFASPGKSVPRGVDALTRARARVGASVHVIALGGVDASTSRACFEAGAHGVAVIRALLGAASPADVALGLVRDALLSAPSIVYPHSTDMTAAPTTYDETLRITTEILTSHVDLDRDIVATDHIQNDLGLDSLGVMEVVADIEDRFEVNIPTDTLSNIATVGDVAQALVKLKQ